MLRVHAWKSQDPPSPETIVRSDINCEWSLMGRPESLTWWKLRNAFSTEFVFVSDLLKNIIYADSPHVLKYMSPISIQYDHTLGQNTWELWCLRARLCRLCIGDLLPELWRRLPRQSRDGAPLWSHSCEAVSWADVRRALSSLPVRTPVAREGVCAVFIFLLLLWLHCLTHCDRDHS